VLTLLTVQTTVLTVLIRLVDSTNTSDSANTADNANTAESANVADTAEC
jgi:hypothetical protein